MLASFARQLPGRRVLCVTHGDMTWAYLFRLETLTMKKWIAEDKDVNRPESSDHGVRGRSTTRPTTAEMTSPLPPEASLPAATRCCVTSVHRREPQLVLPSFSSTGLVRYAGSEPPKKLHSRIRWFVRQLAFKQVLKRLAFVGWLSSTAT